MFPWNANKKRGTSTAVKAGIGAALGGILCGLMLAPKSGEETRKNIVKKAKETANSANGLFSCLKEKMVNIRKQLNKKCCTQNNCTCQDEPSQPNDQYSDNCICVDKEESE